MNFEKVTVGGFPTAVASRADLAKLMACDCIRARDEKTAWLPRLIFSSNGQGIALAGKDSSFALAMTAADLIHADGMSVVAASRMAHRSLPERVATTDFFHDAAVEAQAAGLRFFFLGATEQQNETAVQNIRRLYPQLLIAGRHHGYLKPGDDEHLCRLIRDSRTDVLWVALGKPRQELWCVANKENLRGVGWVKTCGGLYSFLAGDVKRAPVWMQSLGLEWLYRAFQEPMRLGSRYLVTNPYAVYRLLRYTERRKC